MRTRGEFRASNALGNCSTPVQIPFIFFFLNSSLETSKTPWAKFSLWVIMINSGAWFMSLEGGEYVEGTNAVFSV